MSPTGLTRGTFVCRKPKWIKDNWESLSGCFAARELGDQPVELTADRLPYGANFAVRGDVQRANPFDTRLGRRAGAVLGEDELELMRRLLADGQLGNWAAGVPGATVEHLIPADRATTKYVMTTLLVRGGIWF